MIAVAEAADAEDRVSRRMLSQGVQRHRERLTGQVGQPEFLADSFGPRGQQIGLGENQRHWSRRVSVLQSEVVLDDLLGFLLAVQPIGPRVEQDRIEAEPNGVALLEELSDWL